MSHPASTHLSLPEEQPCSTSRLLCLPDELLQLCAAQLLPLHPLSLHHLSITCSTLNRRLQHLTSLFTSARSHPIRWGVERAMGEDVVLTNNRRGLRTSQEAGWNRSYGLPLKRERGVSVWGVRIDHTRANQGLNLLGIALVERKGVSEWCLSPFYGRLMRRSWDCDGNLLMATPPPDGFPDGHLRQMLTNAQGEHVRLEGRACGCVIQVHFDHDAGSISFSLDGGPPGPRLSGFPKGTSHTLIRPVIGLRWPEDQVTIHCWSQRITVA